MKLYFWVLSFLLSLGAFAQQDPKNPFGLTITSDYKTYKAIVANRPNEELVEIKKAIPSIVLDIRYATKNNFMRQQMYGQARAFARKPVVDKLKAIQSELKMKGYGLKIFDGYRPYAITLLFYAKASDKNFVANPAKGSKHNRGCAVDLTLVNLRTKKEIAMPTPYDSFSAAASSTFENLTPNVKANRDFLISTMAKHGFKVIPNEWWHYDFIGWQNYSLMDIPLEKL